MAQKVVTLYTDDLTGEQSDEINTYTVLVNGAGVDIDLTPESYDKLMEALQPFLQATGARRVREGGKPAKGRRTDKSGSSRKTADVRAWAKGNGFDINNRGRIPAPVVEAYEKAHGA